MSRPKITPPLGAHQLAMATQASASLNLTRDEKSILDAFRAMDNRRKWEALVRMERIATTYPHRAVPRLRLVAGAAND